MPEEYKCTVIGCPSQSLAEGRTYSFHKFPKEPELLKKWISETKIPDDFKLCKTAAICSLHFGEEDLYLFKGTQLRLKKNAVPLNQKRMANNVLANKPKHIKTDKFKSQAVQVNLKAQTSSIKIQTNISELGKKNFCCQTDNVIFKHVEIQTDQEKIITFCSTPCVSEIDSEINMEEEVPDSSYRPSVSMLNDTIRRTSKAHDLISLF